ncbi:MAG: cytochrome c3 family protein [Gammaproteobacteria bacterium]|nr:cytochrome c3 family protein [Gammaproteobacteria bacterium]
MQADTASSELSTVSNKHMSLACLSCHDGTQAMDNMINAPGSDGYNTDGGGSGGVTAAQSSNWNFGSDWSSATTFDSGAGGEVNALGQMQGNGSNGTAMGLGQTDNGGTVAMLSPDLSNDHPIAMAFCGGGVGSDGASSSCRDTYFNNAATTTDSIGNTMWYVPTAGSTTVSLGTSASSGLRLYGNVSGGATDGLATDNPTVECGSCHDPHTATPTFLRISNAGSAVCLTCHNK